MDCEVSVNTRLFYRRWLWVALLLLGAALVAFVALTPPAFLDKAGVIGAVVCHRIPSHSFFIHEHQTVLCQRCTGTFTAALTGLLIQWGFWQRRRQQGFPHWSIVLLLLSFVGVWGFDGLNSYFTLLPAHQPLLYPPQPWLRLLTGTLVGMGMSVILVPAFNLTLWADGEAKPSVTWPDIGRLTLILLLQAGLIYTRVDILLYPLALYSVLAVFTLLTALGTMIVVMALGYDNRFTSWREALPFVLWGALVAVALMAFVLGARWLLTGTLAGMPGVE